MSALPALLCIPCAGHKRAPNPRSKEIHRFEQPCQSWEASLGPLWKNSQSFQMLESRMTLNSQQSSGLCLLNSGTRGMNYHIQLLLKEIPLNMCYVSSCILSALYLYQLKRTLKIKPSKAGWHTLLIPTEAGRPFCLILVLWRQCFSV